MPFVTQEQDDAQSPLIGQQPPTVAPTPQQMPESPSLLDTAAAALRQNNILSSTIAKWENGGFTNYPAQPGYSPYDDGGKAIAGFDPERFVHSESPEQTQSIINQINSERADQETIARAGHAGFAASLAAGAVDPVNLAAMLIPGIGEEAEASRLAMIARGAAANAVTGEVQAGALASTQQTGDYTRGMGWRVGTNALLGGILGGIAARVPKPEMDSLAQSTAQRLEAPESSTAGAAAVQSTSLADESIAKGGQTIAKTVGQVSPITRIFSNSKVSVTRQIAQQLTDVPFMLEKNLRGIATPSSIEMRVNAQENIRNATLFREFDRQYAAYKMGGGDLSKGDFSAAVADAMRNGDQHEIPEVRKVAQTARPMFQADRAALAKLGAMAKGDDVLGAPSYFPRVYDQFAIMHDRAGIEQKLTDWFNSHPKLDEDGLPIESEPAEVKQRVLDALDNIQGAPRGTTEIPRLKLPKSLKARTLDVPDEILKPYLSSDFEHVMSSYNRSVLPQIEMRKQFGNIDLKDQLDTVRDAYNIKAQYADNEGKAKLLKQRDADIRDLTLIRDRVLNQTGPRGNEPLQMVRAAQLIRSYNYTRMLGGQNFSALPDFGRTVTRYGLINTGRRLGMFLHTLVGGENLSKADAQRLGTALDNVLHTRAHTLVDVGDDTAGSQVGAHVRNATARFTKLTGIASWDAAMRTLSSQLEQDALSRLITKGNSSVLERAKLAAHGIGDAELPAVRDQWLKYGSSEGGLNRARTELWDDQNAAQLVEQAVQRAASSSAFFVSKGDLPGFANSQIGKLILQFKSFAISSVNRLVIPLAQGIAHRDVAAANGLMVMLALGAMADYMKSLADGYKYDLSDPGSVVANAVQRSGVLAYLPDIYSIPAGMLHLPTFNKFSNLSWMETAGGPTIGTMGAVGDAIYKMTSGKVTAADLHKIRTLLPYQNMWFLARLVNMLEGETADALNAKGAPGKSAADYFNPSADIAPKSKTDKTHLFGVDSIPNSF